MKKTMQKVRFWGAGLAAAALCAIVNPAVVGCSDADSEEPAWGYTAEDMEAAVVGEYVGQVDGKNVSVRISRPKAAAPPAAAPDLRILRRSALQCGGRSFVRPAGACAPTSTMDLDAEVTSEANVLEAGTFQGNLVVFGGTPIFGHVSFSIHGTASLGAEVNDGVVTRWYSSTPNGQTELALARVP